MGKSLSLSAYGVGAPPRRAVSLIVPHKHTPCPPLGLIAAGHPNRYGLKVNNLPSNTAAVAYNRQAMAYLDYLLASELFWSENLVLLEIATAIHIVD